MHVKRQKRVFQCTASVGTERERYQRGNCYANSLILPALSSSRSGVFEGLALGVFREVFEVNFVNVRVVTSL